MFKYLNDKRMQFSAWVANKLPGWKTKGIAALGAISMFAASMQDYISGLPLGEFVTPKTIALVTGGLFTLTYWLRSISDYKS